MIEDNFVVNVQVAVFHSDRVLLIHRATNKGHAPDVDDLPGGRLEASEIGADALEKAALREIEEETGLTLKAPLTYVCSALFVATDGTPVVNVVFKVVLDPFVDAQVTPGIDETDAFWQVVSSTLISSKVPEWTRGYLDMAWKAR